MADVPQLPWGGKAGIQASSVQVPTPKALRPALAWGARERSWRDLLPCPPPRSQLQTHLE